MKKVLFCCLFISSYQFVSAQPGMWAWMKGLNGSNGNAVYGTLGVANINNTPPALYEAAEWKDQQGRFWLFGGLSSSENNALWMYDKSSNSWTWEGGSDLLSQPGNYGTQGIPDVNNCPGSRAWGCASWVDLYGNFWLFGGTGYDVNGSIGQFNDLWRYNLNTKEWTWMAGSNIVNEYGVYGTQGVSDPSNTPGARGECTATWVDDDGHLWIFGGLGYDAYGDAGDLDDLWKFNTSTNEWTWMKGADYIGDYGDWGTLGIPSSTNLPWSRACYSRWKDSQNNFWLFGGYSTAQQWGFNDLWKYDPSTNEWTWMSGTSNVNDAGTYTFTCDLTTTNFPKSRMENRACWTDADGKFWFFGGMYDQYAYFDYNDLWYYDPATNEWSWVSGSSGQNILGVYGTQGIPDAGNYPATYFGSTGWIDDSCHLWLFGGVHSWNSNKSNVLWKYIPGCGACAATTIAFGASETSLCEKFCIDFFDQSTNNPSSWLWQFPGGNPSSSTQTNPADICYNEPGTYDVTLITTTTGGYDTLTLSNYLTVSPTPPTPVITKTNNTLTSSPAYSYQWQLNATDIPGATNQSYETQQTGFYTVIISDVNGCKNSSTLYVGIDEVYDQNILVYPNPSNGNFIIELMNAQSSDEISLTLINTLGQKFYSSLEKRSSADWKQEIYLNTVPAGVYFIEIKSNNFFARKKITFSY